MDARLAVQSFSLDSFSCSCSKSVLFLRQSALLGIPCRAIGRRDAELLVQTAELSMESCGLTQPHPNAACILTNKDGIVVSRASLWAQGATSPEVLSAQQANGAAKGGTAYLNLETGDCHGDDTALKALIQCGIERCVVGMRHPLPFSRNKSIDSLLAAGIQVDVFDGHADHSLNEELQDKLDMIYESNCALLHRAALRKPLGILKYAMTLDGKIAATSGHSAWISCPASRQVVFDVRSRCDAVIIGGQTVRRDNPQLTIRQEGHQPARIVMSRSLNLPEEANLWETKVAPTIVATQRGARVGMQKLLQDKGVEVVEFDFLTPEAVFNYCYQRGFLSCLWECGGTLAAPAVEDEAIHRVMAFIAPKIIGGVNAPSPMGDLGFVEMNQALQISGSKWTQVGPDILVTGYLPASGGPRSLAHSLGLLNSCHLGNQFDAQEKIATNKLWLPSHWDDLSSSHYRQIEFYKSWDHMGFLSNFSAHPIDMPRMAMTQQSLEKYISSLSQEVLDPFEEPIDFWPSTEHYYQSQKFHGVDIPLADDIIRNIANAKSPEEAARIGRRAERDTPEIVRPDWPVSKPFVMEAALTRKFALHKVLRDALMQTGLDGMTLVESSPHDTFWGKGFDGTGRNMLGITLMRVRKSLMK